MPSTLEHFAFRGGAHAPHHAGSDRALATYRTSRSLWERQRDPREDRPGRLDRRVVEVDLKEIELLVEQIHRSNRDETIPLRQTVRDRRIEGPELVAAGPKGNSGVTEGRERAVLIPVC